MMISGFLNAKCLLRPCDTKRELISGESILAVWTLSSTRSHHGHRFPDNFQQPHLRTRVFLQWDKPPPDPGTNISLIPYVLTNYTKDHENDGKKEFNWDVGIDAKISVTPSLKS